VVVTVLGTTFDLEVDPGLAEEVRLGLVADGTPTKGSARLPVRVAERDGRWEVQVGSDRIEVPAGKSVLETILTEMNRLVFQLCPHLAVHAGAVALGDRVIAFPANSGGGKSTITAAFLRGGFDYVSDEALCLRRSDNEVVGYPRPIDLSRHSRAVLGLAESSTGSGSGVLPAAFDVRVARGPLRLTDVVMLDRRIGALSVDRISRGEVVHLLLRHSFNHFQAPSETFAQVVRIAREVRGWVAHYENAPEAVEALKEGLAAIGATDQGGSATAAR
jgi:serine kinase of HPr protein (carbohydrate metabolism regulator)